MMPRETTRKSRERSYDHDKRRAHARKSRKPKHQTSSSQSGSNLLSASALARLNKENLHRPIEEHETAPRKKRRKRPSEVLDEKAIVVERKQDHKRRKRRLVSGALLEEGNSSRLKGLRGGDRTYEEDDHNIRRRKKRLLIGIGVAILVLLIIIVVAVVVSNKNKGSSSSSSTNSGSSSSSSSGDPSNSNLNGVSESSIPVAAKGTYLDPFSWYDTTDFNVTYTNDTVGGLPLMGLYSTWDDSKSANSNTPPISTAWGSYSTLPARGVNLGGWLSLEPFITPSLFNYAGVIDEYTLVSHLGPDTAKSTLEKHYATFVTEQTFADIANAGLDHVRIPFSYWAVATYDDDPYIFRVSWRYLLRGIEWARKHGLRINLDLHGLPGSQNGWNHSGRQGAIGWLNGADGSLNAQRSLDVHNQLSQFFAQDRYKNIITFYGLANEPKMTALDTSAVLEWTTQAYTLVTKNGIKAYIVFGDGFMGLQNWQGKLTSLSNAVLDVHQYVIFNKDQIVYNHTTKVTYACTGWTEQAVQSMNVATGFGPTIFAEWSQADTDCAPNLNNVGWGTRWEGNYNSGDKSLSVLSPGCPLRSSQCDCSDANADPSTYSSTYKQFLQMFAEAQMKSFEEGWGWFYWTWITEGATQWSYKRGLAAGILPQKAYAPDFKCDKTVPSFSGLPESY